VAQLVIHLTLDFSSGHDDLRVVGSNPGSGSAFSTESACPSSCSSLDAHKRALSLSIIFF